MEESKKQQVCESVENAQLATELRKIDHIQKSISDMQAHIQFLLKRENEEEKKTHQIYLSSVKNTSSKLNLVASHVYAKERIEQVTHQIAEKSNRVRELRETENNKLKQTRLQVSQSKEIQRSQVQQISIKNREMIRRMREKEINKKRNQACSIRKDHINKIETLKAQKQYEKKRKEELQLQKNLSRISLKPKLEETMITLRERQKQIVERLEKKKQMQNAIQETAKEIARMKDEDLLEATRKFNNGGYILQKQSGIETPNTLRRSRVSKSVVKSVFTPQRMSDRTPASLQKKQAEEKKLGSSPNDSQEQIQQVLNQSQCESDGPQQGQKNVRLKDSMIKTAIRGKDYNMTSIIYLR